MTEPLPVETIEELEKLEREATAGPWTDRFVTHESAAFEHERRFVQVEQSAGEMLFQREVASIDAHDFGKRIARYQSDAKLLCALRNAAPQLLAASRRVAELERELAEALADNEELNECAQILANAAKDGQAALQKRAENWVRRAAARSRASEAEGGGG